MFVMVGYIRGMTAKSYKYGEYRSFGQLLFLFVNLLTEIVCKQKANKQNNNKNSRENCETRADDYSTY